MKLARAVNAIAARMAGVFDDPDLMSFGPLTTTEDDVRRIKAEYLKEGCGFTIGDRDPNFNRNYPGKFMSIESHEESEGPTDDGSNGPWCIVGDDLGDLINRTWDCWAGEYPDRPDA